MDAFEEWESGFTRVLEAFVAAMNQCDATAHRQWAPALVADADQLRAASRTIEGWCADHPCPDRDLDILLVRVARSYANAAASLESVAKGAPSTWLVVDQELRGLHGMVAKVLTMLFDRSQGSRPGALS